MRSVVIIGLLLFSLAASAATDVRLRAATKLFHRGSYSEAVNALLPLIADEKLSEEDRVRARQYLAAALFANEEKAAAKQELVALAREHPHSRLDPGEFVPELVLLEREALAQVEAELKEARERSAELAAQQTQESTGAIAGELTAPVDARSSATRSLRLQGGAFGFGDVYARSVGAGATVGISWSKLDASARLLIGPNVGAGVEVGFRFLDTMVTPRIAVRGTAVPGIGVVGGGLVGGLRADLATHLFATVDVALEGYLVPDDYSALAVPVTAGLHFSL